MNKIVAEKIGRKWFEELWGKADLDVADEIVDPNYKPDWIHIDAKGPAQVKHEIKYFRSIFPDLRYEIIEIKGEEDKVWVRYKGRGTHRGEGWGFKPSNNIVEFEGATILYLNSEEKIIDRWGAFCFYDIFADLGLLPSFGELHKFFLDYKR